MDLDVDSSFGANARGGYRFHPHFAAELEADWHSPFESEATFGLTPYAKVKVEPLVFTANLKGYLFKDRFQPYAVVGVGVMTAYCKVEVRSRHAPRFRLAVLQVALPVSPRASAGGSTYT